MTVSVTSTQQRFDSLGITVNITAAHQEKWYSKNKALKGTQFFDGVVCFRIISTTATEKVVQSLQLPKSPPHSTKQNVR